MCAMALVHSRIRRVVYYERNKEFLGYLNEELDIRKLEVNHKYEVFFHENG